MTQPLEGHPAACHWQFRHAIRMVPPQEYVKVEHLPYSEYTFFLIAHATAGGGTRSRNPGTAEARWLYYGKGRAAWHTIAAAHRYAGKCNLSFGRGAISSRVHRSARGI